MSPDRVQEVIVVASFVARPGKEEQGAQYLGESIAPTHENPDCLLFALHRALDEPGTFTFVERWSSREQLEASYDTAEFKTFIRDASAFFAGDPTITLYEASPHGQARKGSLAGSAGS